MLSNEMRDGSDGMYGATGSTNLLGVTGVASDNEDPREAMAMQILELLNANGLTLKFRNPGEGLSFESMDVVTVNEEDSLSFIMERVNAKINRCADALLLRQISRRPV